MPTLRADTEERIIDLLRRRLPDWKTTTIKQRLKNGLVLVDGRPAAGGTYTVKPGQSVEILAKPAMPAASLPRGIGEPPMEILYADPWLLAVDKPSGLLSVASEHEKHETAVRILREWLAEADPEAGRDLHAAHRLDRDASGVLLFARSLETKRRLAAAWKNFEKIYLAVTDGAPQNPEGVLDDPLWEDRGLFVRVVGKGAGEEALTHYRLVRTKGARSLLEVRLGTGRKHQIRVHLAHLGCPIVGDRRYGVSKATRLALHAQRLVIDHPDDGRRIEFRAKTPPLFSRLLAQGKGMA